MKKLIFIVACFFAFIVQGQTITKGIYQVDATGGTLAGAMVFPADYATTSDSLLLLDFNHGKGEAALSVSTTTLGDPINGGGVFANGSPLSVAGSAVGPFTAVSPTTGKTIRFIMFGLQGIGGWDAQAAQVAYVIQNNLLKNYPRINKVCITGLSAGGQTTFEAILGPNASLYCGAAPMSSPSPDDRLNLDWTGPAINNIKSWVWHGTQDIGGPTDYYNIVHVVDHLNSIKGGLIHFTSPNVPHCCWNFNYAPSTRENITYYYSGVKATKLMNLYEFFAACATPGFVFDTAGSITNPPPPLIATISAKVTVNGNTVTFDGTASTGSIGSWWWDITDSAGKSYKPSWDNYRNDGGGQPAVKTATGFIKGSYTAKLTVNYTGGGSGTATATFVVGGAVIVPPPASKTVTSVSLSVVAGITVVTITWSDGTTTSYQ